MPIPSPRAAAQAQRPDARTLWPFAPLTDLQQRERTATESALRADRLRVFRAFDDTVAAEMEHGT